MRAANWALAQPSRPIKGEIVAVGSGIRDKDGVLRPLDLEPGDRILFGKWSGTEVKLGGEELMIMKESDGWVSSKGCARHRSRPRKSKKAALSRRSR